MRVLMLCGYFEAVHQQEIVRKAKNGVENAANTFQRRLIEGFESQITDFQVVSAPFIGAYPITYKDMFFKGFENASDEEHKITYVNFNNIWGYRNISRSAALKKKADEFLNSSEGEPKAIVIYTPHTPFLEAAVYAKQKDPSIHIPLVAPDLPQYMNVSDKPHRIYDFFKSFDIKRFYRLNEMVDSYTLLTEPMADVLKVGSRPYIVVEALADIDAGQKSANKKKNGQAKRIAFAGKLVESYGFKRLLEAFSLIEDENVELHICGGGECQGDVEKLAESDSRVHFYGSVPAEQANELMQSADVLVNPRLNEGEYTKYSFPSKNLEYLLIGNAVVAYMLDGIPEIYRDYLVIPEDNTVQALKAAICSSLYEDAEKKESRINGLLDYVQNRLTADKVASRIMKLM